MKTFLKKCGWFVGLIILINSLYLLLLLCFSPGFKKMYNLSQLKNKNYDLIVLGNSMALDGIDAAYLSQKGLNSYNFAVAGDHVSTSLMILETYLRNNIKPKAVLIGLSSSIGNSYLNEVPFTNPEVEFFYHPSFVSNLTNPPLFNFQWLAVDMMKIVVSKDFRDARMIRGQWKTKKNIVDTSIFKKTVNPNLEYSNPYLLKIVKECKKRRIKVIFVELPGANENRNNLPFEYTVQLLDNNSTIYNLNNYEVSTKIIDASTDWLAQDHLNENGAKKITDFLYHHVIKKEMSSTEKILY